MHIDYVEAKEELRKWAVKYTGGYDLQSGGWPCGNCFINLLIGIGLDKNDPQYHKHNPGPISRINEVWRAVLQIRETVKIDRQGEDETT
jgi:hypothetical protein